MADLNIGFSAVATGTADVITATYSPAITLSDKRIAFLRTVTPNTTTTPTFNPNGLGAQTITKNNGDPLAVGDLDGVVILMYDYVFCGTPRNTYEAGAHGAGSHPAPEGAVHQMSPHGAGQEGGGHDHGGEGHAPH